MENASCVLETIQEREDRLKKIALELLEVIKSKNLCYRDYVYMLELLNIRAGASFTFNQ